jgi:aspartate dehydrogenase
MSNTDLRLAIAGLGAIGMRVAKAVDGGQVAGIKLVAVSANDKDAAANRVSGLENPPTIMGLAELADHADIIVECAPAAVFGEVARAAVAKGRTLLPLSVGALLLQPELEDQARTSGAKIIVPTGAIIGLDTVRAMGVGEIFEVKLETRKPPNGLSGAPHLVENSIDVSNLSEPCWFSKAPHARRHSGFQRM